MPEQETPSSTDEPADNGQERIEQPATPPPDDDKELGPEGEKALAIWKQQAKEYKAKAKQADELQARIDEIERAQMSEQEKAIEQAKKEAVEQTRSEVLAGVQRERFTDKLAAVAAGRLVDDDLFADPDVALKLLGLDEIPTTDNGGIDAEAISVTVDRFLQAKPHFAVSATQPAPLNQGARERPEQVDPGELSDVDDVLEWGQTNRRQR